MPTKEAPPKDSGEIRSDEEYQAALAEMDALWDSAPGSGGHKRLLALAERIDAYEDSLE